MAKKKLTLQQQYERQLKRIEKRIAQLQAEGYNVTSEIDLTKTPKRARREQVEKLRKITPAKLRKSAENGNITVTTRKKKKRKGPAKPKLQTAPSGKPPLPSNKLANFNLTFLSMCDIIVMS